MNLEGSDNRPPRLKTRRAYSGKVISLDVDTVRFPDGSVGELEMIRHPGASAVVPFLDDPRSEDPRILLIRQYRYAADSFLLEIPAGQLEPGETPEACAARELEEETGRKARNFRKLFELYTTPGFTDERIHLFVAWNLEAGTLARERDEFIDEVPVRLSTALQMTEGGEIVDAKTALGILCSARLKDFS
ncbi:MAG TPA: NUDIX hydrolase [Thermoanaerobaculia bacterium]|nr:NUDIX hydrolase [Thermoanaerobaculia bacterium]